MEINCKIILGDCLERLKEMESDSADLVFTSPPYEAARTYGIGFNLRGQDWVDWAFARYVECVRVSRGLVAWVVEGQTRQFRYTATPALLMADLHRAGVKLRKPPIFHRVGIPGSGGPDWLRNDWEWIICAAKGKLPWSDNTACGAPPKYPAGGPPSHRLPDGTRTNDREKLRAAGVTVGGRQSRTETGERRYSVYIPPKMANPGNVISCKVGGGHIGSRLAHDNEAPFPEKLAEFFIRSFCPPGGVVLDPFCGSGTTLKVALAHGRQAIGIDVRESQVELSGRRILEVPHDVQ